MRFAISDEGIGGEQRAKTKGRISSKLKVDSDSQR